MAPTLLHGLLALALPFAAPAAVAATRTVAVGDGVPQDGGVVLTAPAVLWTSTTGNSGHAPSLADGGLLAATASGGAGLRLYSAFDATPPVSLTAPGDLWLAGSRAARRGDLLLSSTLDPVSHASAVAHLHAYRLGEDGPLWSFLYADEQLFPFPAFDVSDDGSVVVSLFADEATGALDLRLHDVATGVATAEHGYTGWPLTTGAGDLSADGSVFGFSDTDGTGKARLLDPVTGALVGEARGTLPKRQGLSADGSRVAVRVNMSPDGWVVRAVGDTGTTYETLLEVPSAQSDPPVEFAINDEGTVLAIAYYDGQGSPTSCRLEAWDVDAGALLLTRTFGGGPDLGLHNVPSGVALSADGRRLAIGMWGLAQGALAELQVFDPFEDVLLAAFPLGGTVFKLDIAPDGQRVLAHRIGNHASQGHTTERLELYDLGGHDLALHGVPALGALVGVSVHGEPGAFAWLLAGASLAPVPLPVGQAGALLLDPDAYVLLPWGDVDASGILTRNVVLPAAPILLGVDLYLQGATTGPLRLGVTALHFSLLPG